MQQELFATVPQDDFISIPEAGQWATRLLGKRVTNANITYLIQYGRINKFFRNGLPVVSKKELLHYYKSRSGKRQTDWEQTLGEKLNWTLSFEQCKEAETTKHVHRLHPYKGKFIPQLVEYFLDEHIDSFKKDVFFHEGDVVLDPFCGSGTTLVQANELGIHAIGVDISEFNTVIANTKIQKYNLPHLETELSSITNRLRDFIADSAVPQFEDAVSAELLAFNNKYFPSPQFKIDVRQKHIDEKVYGAEKAKEFLPFYEKLLQTFHIQLKQKETRTFLDKWYVQNIRNEIDFVFQLIEKIPDESERNIAKVILSRTMRSCRATTHSDLATIYEPVTAPYYCTKHGKICKPLFSILRWWNTYAHDTVKRLAEFQRLRTPTFQYCVTGDSRTINLYEKVKRSKRELYELIKQHRITGIFSSPPYVGLIDYHEQHAYAYDIFGFTRHDDLEIGPLFKGKGREARESYVEGISAVLNNAKQYLAADYNVFLVANDKFNMYPLIAEKAGMRIVNRYHRPVLNRTEKDKGAYSETIFHLKEKAPLH